MTSTTSATPWGALREEDLVVGKAWVHPETFLEYEDFHAFFCGKDPLPHWRNARIKAIHFARSEYEADLRQGQLSGIPTEPFERLLARRFEYYRSTYDRDGNFLTVYRPLHGVATTGNTLLVASL